MKQLCQKLKSGEMNIVELPVPKAQAGELLVQCQYSLISAGTESSAVQTARKGFIGKAKERPEQLKQVIDTLKTHGPVQTYRAVMKKLDAYSPLGYSCAGKVVDIGRGSTVFQIGDLVACGGFSASHADFVTVPKNLCVKLKPDADLSQAAYNTLGAIAMQGIRQADLRLGETCAIIGLGLLGQLTALILRASSVRTIGIDINKNMVDIAQKNCLDVGLVRDTAGIETQCLNFSDGLGCDAVIITAGSKSLDPVNFAGAIARKKGKIVVVGAVPTGFDREPHYYKKELQLLMSCSYGPGRYDPNYEQKGIDYPAAYVRWTEQRNMQAFQRLIADGKIDVSYLTTHRFKLKDAPEAYNLILQHQEPHIGILIEYDENSQEKMLSRKITISTETADSRKRKNRIGVGFIGAGSYAMNHLIPNLMKNSRVNLRGVMTASGPSSRSVAERSGFEYATTDDNEILCDDKIDAVFIATRHDTHFQYVINALKNKKHVFVEKPLCLNVEQLSSIIDQLEDNFKNNIHSMLMVGYNRRFSPAAEIVMQEIPKGTMAVTYRINAGFIPPDSWIQDSEIGGGRIIGEVCHFIDFITYLTGSNVKSIQSAAMSDPYNNNDTISIILGYQNGSIGNINYFSNGEKGLKKEAVEVFSSGCAARIDDFKELTIYKNGKKKTSGGLVQNKGQKAEVNFFIDNITQNGSSNILLREIINTSVATFGVIESLRTGQPFYIG